VLLSDWRVLLRRWYMVLAGVIVTAGLCTGAAAMFPARWVTTSTVLMLPPESRVDGVPVNPYLNLGGLEGMADVLSTALGDAEVQDEIATAAEDVEYFVGRDPARVGPVVVVEVTAASPQDATAAQAVLLERLPARLDELQESVDVRDPARITSSVITEDDEPEASRRGQIRAVLVTAVGGLALTYLATAAVDGIAAARRRRREATRFVVSAPLGPPQQGHWLESEPAVAAAGSRGREPAG
jgi:hypothetical protein